ncbi:hypothetical protein DICPUDRAFT_80719 [Dictyostelium purpureum]|uniref:RING-type domain-containing protein n=1 Tax=Dictyostelium purpureum TaxID=5786 RepID=F0ZRB5_DICPU|nr:uncharacterized protein DICPUDRAFT_80719 [Dictyostelium purpureum]EGC33534.1 hypothetical protein DICPUDRAFT_80719 [Dictyostelium purpureum]|eukprot:XP_003289959.1 hypothetical protein DICPUDRAFT_80719 [Dictyostelium purpureum]
MKPKPIMTPHTNYHKFNQSRYSAPIDQSSTCQNMNTGSASSHSSSSPRRMFCCSHSEDYSLTDQDIYGHPLSKEILSRSPSYYLDKMYTSKEKPVDTYPYIPIDHSKGFNPNLRLCDVRHPMPWEIKIREEERLEKERQEKERIETLKREKLEKERLELLEKERQEKERIEALEKERQENERRQALERARLIREQQEREQKEREEREERERIQAILRERLQREQERIRRENLERARLEREREEREEREKEQQLREQQLREQEEREERERLEREQQQREQQEREERERIENLDRCTICIDRIEPSVLAIIDCNHKFCYDCIMEWCYRRDNICPNCRAPFFLVRRVNQVEGSTDEANVEQGNQDENPINNQDNADDDNQRPPVLNNDVSNSNDFEVEMEIYISFVIISFFFFQYYHVLSLKSIIGYLLSKIIILSLSVSGSFVNVKNKEYILLSLINFSFKLNTLYFKSTFFKLNSFFSVSIRYLFQVINHASVVPYIPFIRRSV